MRQRAIIGFADAARVGRVDVFCRQQRIKLRSVDARLVAHAIGELEDGREIHIVDVSWVGKRVVERRQATRNRIRAIIGAVENVVEDLLHARFVVPAREARSAG